MNKHTPGFVDLVQQAKQLIREVPATEMPDLLKRDPNAILIDVREDREYEAGHVEGAVHIGKGVIERDIEKAFPDRSQTLYLYCGGGFRSALAANALRQMGYDDPVSIDGGWSQLKDLLPIE